MNLLGDNDCAGMSFPEYYFSVDEHIKKLIYYAYAGMRYKINEYSPTIWGDIYLPVYDKTFKECVEYLLDRPYNNGSVSIVKHNLLCHYIVDKFPEEFSNYRE